ncbi:MAG: TonB-dependent receptor [Burkholderiaceae bacterium]
MNNSPLRHIAALVAAAGLGVAQAAPPDLTTLSLEQLLDVKVVGASKYEQRQNEVAASVHVITRQEIKSFGWRTLDEALASLPGVYGTYDRQYAYLGTRGFSVPGDFNTRVLLTINGNRVNDAVYDQAYIGRDFPLDLDLIERIEFIPGPGGAVYGQNALFGVVNVVTRGGAAIGGAELALAAQQPQGPREGRATWGRRLDTGTDVVLSVSGMKSRGEDRFFSYGASGISGVAVGLDGERDREFFGRVAHGPWSFELVHGNRSKDDPTAAYFGDPLVPGALQRDRIVLAQLNYEARLGEQSQLSVRTFSGREHYEAPAIYSGADTVSSVSSSWRGVEARLLITSWASHKLLLGVEHQDNLHQDQYYDDRQATPDVVDVAILRSGRRSGVFAQDQWSITDTVGATLGLRVDHDNVIGRSLSPRAALVWQADPGLNLKALYGRAHRAPNVYEHDFDDGVTLVANPALRGETINTTELVADLRASRDLLLRGAVYRWTMHGLVTQGLDPVSGMPQFQNGQNVTAHGVELSADKTWDWGGRLRGSVTWQHARHQDGNALANSPERLGKLNLATPLGVAGLRLGYELQVCSARRTLAGERTGGYALSNLNLLAERLAHGLELSVGIHNLFDHRYEQPGSRNNWQDSLEQDGRSLRVELSAHF